MDRDEGFYEFTFTSKFIINSDTGLESALATVSEVRVLKADCIGVVNTPQLDPSNTFANTGPHEVTIATETTLDFSSVFQYELDSCRWQYKVQDSTGTTDISDEMFVIDWERE